MTDIIERIRTAIYENRTDPRRSVVTSDAMARAILRAIREPTRAMITAAMIQPHPSVAESGGLIQQAEAATKIDWQAMVDEALK